MTDESNNRIKVFQRKERLLWERDSTDFREEIWLKIVFQGCLRAKWGQGEKRGISARRRSSCKETHRSGVERRSAFKVWSQEQQHGQLRLRWQNSRLSGLNPEIYFSQFFRLGSPRVKCQPVQFLVRTLFYPADSLLLSSPKWPCAQDGVG